MVKKIKLFLIILFIIILIFTNVRVFAKVESFQSFMDEKFITDTTTYYSTINRQSLLYATQVLQKLEYNNELGINQYDLVPTAQRVYDYIHISGNNYAIAIFTHGMQNVYDKIYFNDGKSILNASDVTGNWHLVILNTCYTCEKDIFPQAFNTVGYTNRATIGFAGNLWAEDANEYWKIFNERAGSDSLGNISDYANSVSGAHALVYGFWTWDGYAWK